MELVVHRPGRLPGIEQRFALVEAVLVFHSLPRADLELHRLLLEGAILGDDDGGLAGAVGRCGGQRFHLLAHDAEVEQADACPGAERIDAVFRRQDEHHQDEPGAEERCACRYRKALPGFDGLVGCCAHNRHAARK
jgi:hypothetical protein